MQILKTALFILVLAVKVNAQVLINEFMAENVSTSADMIDYDDFSDWIELYNNQNKPVDLSGYYLTDNLNNPLKWEIPAGTVILPYSCLVLRADGFDAAPGKTSYREYWPWDAFITKRYHTNFKLEGLGEELALFKAGASIVKNIIAAGSDWKYLDDGSDQGAAWRDTAFNDAAWKSGQAEFGYGDGGESTVIGYGSNANDKYITTYFRKSVQITSINNIRSLTLKLLRDDGAVVYINGHEILRSNMPSGTINYKTTAETVIGGTDENTFFTFDLPSKHLVEGNNIFAVEIHQSGSTSTDLSFDMEVNASALPDNITAELIDSVKFGRQIQDVSMGRDPGNNFKWTFYGEPTPGRVNSTSPAQLAAYSGNVLFSLKSGFYNSRQTLILSAQSASEDIYYTTDGSIPEASASQKYLSPILIDSSTVIRARTFAKDKFPGEVTSNSYFINEVKSSLPVATIITDPLTMWDSEVGIYKNNIKGREVPVSLEYFTPDESSAFKVNAGARIGGFNIWRFAEKPLNIYMKSHYGNDLINYQLFDSRPVAAFSAIEFRNGGDCWNTTFITDDMSESILKGQMQNGYAAYKPSIVYINGKYWGIHDLRERTDLQYFASNFKVDPSGIEYMGYVQMPSQSYVIGLEVFEGSAEGYNSFLAFVENNDLSFKTNYELVKSQMDINSFIDYLSTEIYVCNTSWQHNREWWRAKNNDGKWRWLIQDLDRGFNMQNINTNILPGYISNYSLFSRLLKNTEFKNQFIQQFAAHLNSTFASDRIARIIDSLSAGIAPEMPRHIERWKNDSGIPSMAAWNNELSKMKQFAAQRASIVLTQIQNQFSLSGTSDLTINTSIPEGGRIFVNGVPLCGSLSKLKFFKNIPVKISATANPGYTFAGWDKLSDSISVLVTLQKDSVITALFVPSKDILLPDRIDENTVLSIKNNLYVAKGDITISSNAVLRVEKGVNIKMPQSGSIYVKGSLIIEGTEDEMVSITPDEKAGAVRWGAICFDHSAGPNLISNVIIKSASSGKDAAIQKAAISSDNSTLLMDHIIIQNVSFPIFALNGNTTLKNSFISATGTCDYIGIRQGKGLVENNTFYGNKSPDTDAIDFDGDTSCVIRGNRIYNFQGFNCDAIDIGEKSKDILITGNVIYNSKDKGISVGQLSSVTVENNVIAGCDMGVAVKDSSHVNVINNTFFGNNHAIAAYVKNYGQGGGFVTVKNSILSASKVSSVFADSMSAINVTYSISDMEVLPGVHNLFGDPLFTDALNFNLQLRPGSPCFNSGDPGSPKDADGSNADIGAYYSFNNQDFPDSLRNAYRPAVVINEIMYNDGQNPNTKDWLELYNPSDKSIDLSGWKMTDEDSTHLFIFPEALSLKAKDYLIVCKDTVKFAAVFPDIKKRIGDLAFGLDGNDKVMIYDNSGKLVNSVSFHNSYPWPAAADGNGASLELCNPNGFNYLTTNWKSSIGTGGTPGKQNSVYGSTDVMKDNAVPVYYALLQNYPNPFNPVTTISYSVPKESHVELKVFDILGHEVKTLVSKEQNSGEYKIQFDASSLPSGIYIYTFVAGQYRASKKLLLLK